MEQRVKVEVVSLCNGAGALAGARVFIVEDDAIIAMDLEAILGEAGAEVAGPCRTVKDGLIAAAERDLSAALLDIQLGNETVGPVAQLLARRNIPFAFYTGQADTHPIRLNWPECKIISKPARPKAIVNALAEIIRDSPRLKSAAVVGNIQPHLTY
jgi:DNA-binding response OmpR family regulator